VNAHAEKASALATTGAWSVVFIATGRLTPVAAAPGYSRAAVTRGFAIEWNWNGLSADTLSLVVLDGTASGGTVSGASTVPIGDVSTSLDGAGLASQTLFIQYRPDLTTTPADESRLLVAHHNPVTFGMATGNVRFNPNAAFITNYLEPGDDVTVAVVAGEATSRTDARVIIGYDHPFRRMTYVTGESLCTGYP
jgi:hypothetical protein